jgi:hypothetical protein
MTHFRLVDNPLKSNSRLPIAPVREKLQSVLELAFRRGLVDHAVLALVDGVRLAHRYGSEKEEQG